MKTARGILMPRRCAAIRSASSRLAGSVIVEFVLLLAIIVVPILMALLFEFNSDDKGVLHALRNFLAGILVVVGLPLL